MNLLFSLYRYEWADVGAQQPRTPLPQSPGSLHQLHVRRRQSRAHVAARRKSRLELSPAHSRSHRLCPHLTRGRFSRGVAVATDHPRSLPVQVERARRRIRLDRHALQDAQPRVARIER